MRLSVLFSLHFLSSFFSQAAVPQAINNGQDNSDHVCISSLRLTISDIDTFSEEAASQALLDVLGLEPVDDDGKDTFIVTTSDSESYFTLVRPLKESRTADELKDDINTNLSGQDPVAAFKITEVLKVVISCFRDNLVLNPKFDNCYDNMSYKDSSNFDCTWYTDNNCPDKNNLNNDFEVSGEECCACGGGESPPTTLPHEFVYYTYWMEDYNDLSKQEKYSIQLTAATDLKIEADKLTFPKILKVKEDTMVRGSLIPKGSAKVQIIYPVQVLKVDVTALSLGNSIENVVEGNAIIQEMRKNVKVSESCIDTDMTRDYSICVNDETFVDSAGWTCAENKNNPMNTYTEYAGRCEQAEDYSVGGVSAMDACCACCGGEDTGLDEGGDKMCLDDEKPDESYMGGAERWDTYSQQVNAYIKLGVEKWLWSEADVAAHECQKNKPCSAEETDKLCPEDRQVCSMYGRTFGCNKDANCYCAKNTTKGACDDNAEQYTCESLAYGRKLQIEAGADFSFCPSEDQETCFLQGTKELLSGKSSYYEDSFMELGAEDRARSLAEACCLTFYPSELVPVICPPDNACCQPDALPAGFDKCSLMHENNDNEWHILQFHIQSSQSRNMANEAEDLKTAVRSVLQIRYPSDAVTYQILHRENLITLGVFSGNVTELTPENVEANLPNQAFTVEKIETLDEMYQISSWRWHNIVVYFSSFERYTELKSSTDKVAADDDLLATVAWAYGIPMDAISEVRHEEVTERMEASADVFIPAGAVEVLYQVYSTDLLVKDYDRVLMFDRFSHCSCNMLDVIGNTILRKMPAEEWLQWLVIGIGCALLGLPLLICCCSCFCNRCCMEEVAYSTVTAPPEEEINNGGDGGCCSCCCGPAKLFKGLKYNREGYATKGDFIAWCREYAPSLASGQMEALFYCLDNNKDGKVSKRSMKQYTVSQGRVPDLMQILNECNLSQGGGQRFSFGTGPAVQFARISNAV